MSELGNKRKKFTKFLVLLLTNMLNAGYKPMIGKDGLKHKDGSLHFEGLAEDIDLCDSTGNYLTSTEDHKRFGEFWKSLDPDCRWGGDFKDDKGDPKPDGNHYSITYGGRS